MATIEPGERVTCENGHIVAEVIEPITFGQMNYTVCIGGWLLARPPRPGDQNVRCTCGARFWRHDPPSFHIEGRGWVMPPPLASRLGVVARVLAALTSKLRRTA